MSALVIARRELAEKRFVFATAALLSLFPFAFVALVPVTMSGGRSFLVSMSAMTAVGFTLGLATILGVSTIGRDLADNRLSFYFAKPITAPAIWFGKLAAAIIMIGGSFAIILAPSLPFGTREWRTFWNLGLPELAVTAAVAALSLFLVSHVASTMVRSRSAFVLLDLGLAGVFGAATYLLTRSLLRGLAQDLTNYFITSIAALVLTVLVGAGAWQLARGRTDRRQNHIELSRFLWTSLGIVLLLAGGFVGWVVSATPSDLVYPLRGAQADAGPWLLIAGATRHRLDYLSTYFLNCADGSFVRIRPMGKFNTAVVFSRDGRTAAWMELSGAGESPLELFTRRLEQGAPVVDTGISGNARTLQGLALSDDSSRIALLEDGMLRVVDLAAGRTLGSARVGGAVGGYYALFFSSPGVVRVYESTSDREGKDARLRILEYEPARRAFIVTADVHQPARWISTILTSDGKTMLMSDGRTRLKHPSGESGTLTLADARTAAPIMTVPTRGGRATVLDDGRVVYFEGSMLHVVGRDPSVARSIDLGMSKGPGTFVGSPAPGKLVIAINPELGNGPAQGTAPMLVDVDRGVIERRGAGLFPIFGRSWSYLQDPRLPRVNSTRPLLFEDERGAIVRWNPLTGEKKTLISKAFDTRSW